MNGLLNLRLPLQGRFGRALNFERAHDRHECSLVAELFFKESGFIIHGCINEISLGGARFLPSQSYILSRIHDTILMKCRHFELSGELKNTSEKGYGLRFEGQLSDDLLRKIIASPTDQ